MSIAAHIAETIAQEARHSGGIRAFEQMTPETYANLRRLAHTLMRYERSGHTLQPTAVVNEAFLRLARSQVHVNDAPHFYRVAARIMRNLLVDYARERRRLKREAPTVSDMIAASSETDSLHEPLPIMDVLDIDAALDKLGRKAPRAAEILELRYFAGLDDVEISAMCGVSRRTVERECRFAKAFLAAYGNAKPLE
ncbi:MAG: ECF-type sigma factor [Steroidobacteraceae bacterium]|jgi:RNA polymerase sigma factor (TIGR02999 family)|nr:ECF-type sigma factor [Steroidobacteraceae bacterium]